MKTYKIKLKDDKIEEWNKLYDAFYNGGVYSRIYDYDFNTLLYNLSEDGETDEHIKDLIDNYFDTNNLDKQVIDYLLKDEEFLNDLFYEGFLVPELMKTYDNGVYLKGLGGRDNNFTVYFGTYGNEWLTSLDFEKLSTEEKVKFITGIDLSKY